MKKLSAREKIAVLEATKDYLRSVNGDSGIHPTVREAVTAGLANKGYWFAPLGSQREMSVSIEIQRALGLEKGLDSVDEWGGETDRATIIAGLDATIAHLR